MAASKNPKKDSQGYVVVEKKKTPAKLERREFPLLPVVAPRPFAVGEWLLTTRPGAERDLLEELYFTGVKTEARPAGPALVAARWLPRPRNDGRSVELAFARQGFVIEAMAEVDSDAVSNALTSVLSRAGRPQPWALDAWVPDSDETNTYAGRVAQLATDVRARLAATAPVWSAVMVPNARAALAENGLYGQVCVVGDRAFIGLAPAREAPSLAPGGRLRVHVSAKAPSRAAMKLVEAFAWLDRSPERGDQCVDLGAAPGGWSWVLLDRGAKVIAVDPAQLAPSVRTAKGMLHIKADAFHFDPGEPVDWLFCDMAWRPLEAAALLGKWARRRWARLLVANIKLPMKKRAEHLFRIRDILEEAGWNHLRARQLYHDREEITVAAVRV